MATFNKILTPVYSTISGFSMNQDGSMNVTYAIGTGTEQDGQMTDFQPIISEYKYLDAEQAHAVMFAPLAKEDIGKSFQDLILSRVHKYMQEQGMIQV